MLAAICLFCLTVEWFAPPPRLPSEVLQSMPCRFFLFSFFFLLALSRQSEEETPRFFFFDVAG